MSSIAAASTAKPEIDIAIARAERRRGKLERLSDIGMELAEQIGAHAAAAMAAVNEVKGGDPCRAYATVSRAVRMTVALEGKVDAQIIALHNRASRLGEASGGALPPSAISKASIETDDFPLFGAGVVRFRNAVRCVIEVDHAASDESREVLDALHERLTDREPPDWIADRSWREAADEICADLGLAADWSGWSDETGVRRDPPGNRIICSRQWRPRRPGADPPQGALTDAGQPPPGWTG